MTKFRIVRETADGHDQFYVEYRKPFTAWWKTYHYYYKSEFTDMPGWWCDHVNTKDEALELLQRAKSALAPADFPGAHGAVYEYIERQARRQK